MLNKSNRSMYNAISGMSLTLINGLLGLIVTKIVISAYGSDFNGINSTANQLVNMLLILEGGFTLATSVALFKPISEGNQQLVNGIMSATKKTFIRLGSIFLVVGVVIAIGFSFIVKSNLPSITIIQVFLITVSTTGFTLIYETKYRIILQSNQKDYLVNLIRIVAIIVSQILVIIVIRFRLDMILVRLITSLGIMASSFWIAYVCKNQFPDLTFNQPPKFEAVKGTTDIFIAKFTGLLYKSAPIIFISVTSGAVFASVYAVYNSIFLLLKGLLFSFSSAPRIAMGHLILEKSRQYVYEIFIEYEFMVNQTMLVFLSCAAVLIMPFMDVYTYNVTDVVYKNWFVAIFLILATYFDAIHLPAGTMINMAGQFRIGRNIQLTTAIVLIFSLSLGYFLWDFEGVMFSILFTASLLAVLEIDVVYRIYFDKPVIDFFFRLLPSTAFAVLIVLLQINLIPKIFGYWHFFQWGVITFVANSVAFLLFNWLFYPRLMMKVYGRVKNVLAVTKKM